MAITIDWDTKVINIPKADLTLVQPSPIEIREMSLNDFRLELRSIEASTEGMPHLRTHRHNTEVILGGITYARTIEIINGYTVTFEDGQYAVNLVGANSNVGDVVNVNQVSVRSANAAGLISNSAIEFASFQGGVTIDEGGLKPKTTGGTVFPTGTLQRPSSNLSDTFLIGDFRGLNKVYVIGDLTVTNTAVWDRHEFIGESTNKSTIIIEASASVSNCEFYECTLSGTLDGNSEVKNSILADGLDYVDGRVVNCIIASGTITLGTSTVANILSCYSGQPGEATPTIDLNGTGVLALRDYNGGIKLTNYTDTGAHSIDMSSGQVILDSTTITSGIFVVRGNGKLVDESGNNIESGTWNGGVTIVNELVFPVADEGRDYARTASQLSA